MALAMAVCVYIISKRKQFPVGPKCPGSSASCISGRRPQPDDHRHHHRRHLGRAVHAHGGGDHRHVLRPVFERRRVRQISWKKLWKNVYESLYTSCKTLFIIAIANSLRIS
jgi:hypothetical protein